MNEGRLINTFKRSFFVCAIIIVNYCLLLSITSAWWRKRLNIRHTDACLRVPDYIQLYSSSDNDSK